VIDAKYYEENMISVIIPTMWKFRPFLQFLEDLLDSSAVGEVIIINNDISKTPVDHILSHPKVRMYDFGKNIYVNLAWNFGVAQSKFDNICLLNDDVIVDLKLFTRMDKFLSAEIGLCGISPGKQEEFGQVPITSGEIDIVHCNVPYDPRTHFGLGTLMFFHKDVYVPIIDGLDLYWGDNFIYDTMYYKTNENYLITNTFFYTPYAQTTSTIQNANEILQREHIVYNREMPSIINELRISNSHRTGL